MATTKQKKVAKLIIDNITLDKPLNGGEIVENSGYSEIMKKNPKNVIDTEGVKEELQILGFTEENAMSVVSEIMLNPEAQDNNRLKASEMVFKVQGTFAPEKKLNLNANINIKENPQASKLAEEYEEKLLDNLLE